MADLFHANDKKSKNCIGEVILLFFVGIDEYQSQLTSPKHLVFDTIKSSFLQYSTSFCDIFSYLLLIIVETCKSFTNCENSCKEACNRKSLLWSTNRKLY